MYDKTDWLYGENQAKKKQQQKTRLPGMLIITSNMYSHVQLAT